MDNSNTAGQTIELGQLQSVHRSSRFKQIVIFVVGLGCLAISIFGFASWFYVTPGKSDPGIIIFVGLLFLAIALLCFWGLKRTREDEVCFYEKGLSFTTSEGTQVVRWDQVGSFFEHSFQRSVTYSVLTKEDEPVTFRSHLTGITQIGERLKTEAEKRDMPINLGFAGDYVNKMPSLFPK